jgi:hypothetical protein
MLLFSMEMGWLRGGFRQSLSLSVIHAVLPGKKPKFRKWSKLNPRIIGFSA